MTDETMIARRVAIGWDREGSVQLLAELKTSFAPKNLAYALHYNQFITLRQAEKWEAK